MFSILCDSWKTLLFVKIYRYCETFELRCCCFLWSKCFEKSSYFMRYLQNSNMMLIPKFESKADKASSFSLLISLCNSSKKFSGTSLEACFIWRNFYILTDLLNKVTTKLKGTWLIISPGYNLLSLLTLIWMGFLRVRFEGVGGQNYRLSKTRWNYARNLKFGT